ncbi:hypothetical protein P3T76_002977 [Phytophthora citrophthora]|uniref:Uncharacterized protein n=1 Tax=Phytophthora citrophthora TaxID=4793 RepID=A0AAD9GVL7_9STRA|nr:hypothetical protein P3T76_002977 [Phytophthora citrophthora]
MAKASMLSLDTAHRIARAAISSLNVSLRGDLDAIVPTYSWVVITLKSHMASGHTALRNIRESLRVLTVLSSCNGFSLPQNPQFWSEIWPGNPIYEQQQPQWAARWKQLHLRGQPRPSEDILQFLFQVEDAEFRHSESIAVIEELIQAENQEHDSPGFRLTMEILSRHVEDNKWPSQIVCGLDCPNGYANLCKRVFTTNGSEDREMIKMWIPFQLKECFISVYHCLERSGTLKEVANMVDTENYTVPVKEMKLHFGWNPTERNLSKRLREFRTLVWNMTYTTEENARVRVLQLKGQRLSDMTFFSSISSALPFTESLEELRLSLPLGIRSDTRKILWRWLAASVFHSQSTSKLQHLDLSQCNVSTEDVRVIKDVLKREWGSAMLQLLIDISYFKTLSFSHSETTMATIKSNTRIESEPVRRIFSKPLVTLKHSGEFMVLYQREDWICILLPGFGCGFIKQQSVISIRRLRNSCKLKLTSLKLKTEDVSATLSLLRIVGIRLTRLDLECEAFTNEHLTRLISCCPKLTHLILRSAQLNDFSTLINASVSGTCAVSELHLWTRKITTSCLENVARKLSNPELAGISKLRGLRLQTGLLRRTDLEILLGLLQKNQTLRCLHIKIAFYLFDAYMPRFLAHRGDRLRGGEEDQRKLGFLSVVGTEMSGESARQRIDAILLGKIFEFAYPGERCISLDEYTDRMTIQEIVARVNAGQHTRD